MIIEDQVISDIEKLRKKEEKKRDIGRVRDAEKSGCEAEIRVHTDMTSWD